MLGTDGRGYRRSGVAPRWRIRHKLLLGVCLVCGALALLLAGTLRGLWSYYLTMNSIRSKQAELKASKAFLNEIYDLKIFKTSPQAGGDNFFDCFRGLPDKAGDAKVQLKKYEDQLRETLTRARTRPTASTSSSPSRR